MRNVVWGGNAGAVEHARVQRALDQEALAAVEALGKNFTTQAPTRNVGNVLPVPMVTTPVANPWRRMTSCTYGSQNATSLKVRA
jgi:hypothetical protein